MAIDQAEDIRRRLEARQTGNPYVPPESTPTPEPDFQPPPPITPSREPISDLTRKRRQEAAIADTTHAQPVIIVDVKIKFWSLVVLLVKMAFAFIPAGIIITIISWLFFLVMTGLFHKGL